MTEDELIEYIKSEYIKRYEVGTISNNDGIKTILATNDLQTATECFENTVNAVSKDDKYHYKVFLFDYDKNCNLNYYDSINDSI